MCLSVTENTRVSIGLRKQRGAGTRVFGTDASGPVKVTVTVATGSPPITATSAPPGPKGDWVVTLPLVAAANSSTVSATDGAHTDTLHDVAWGDVLLCGGQSNMV